MAKVKCELCQRDFNLITNSHLQKIHNTTPADYLAMFPGARLYDAEMKAHITETRYHVERPICARPGCGKPTTNTNNKYCSSSCSMTHRMSKSGRNEQLGRVYKPRIRIKKPLIERVCVWCKNIFMIESYEQRVCCSKECQSKRRGQLMSVRIKKIMSKQEFRQPFHKHIAYGKQKFRSLWERDFAIYLDLLNVPWKYEPMRIKLSNGENYLPDFYVQTPLGDCYVELHRMVKIEPKDVNRTIMIKFAQQEFVTLTGLPLIIIDDSVIPRLSYRARLALGIGGESVISNELITERLQIAREWFALANWRHGNRYVNSLPWYKP